MPRACTVCTHAARAEIDGALAADEPDHTVAAHFNISQAALARHRTAHLPALPAPAQDAPARPAPSGFDSADELGSLARELARGYAGLVESHRRSWGIVPAEAEAKAREHGEWAVERCATDPPDQLPWWQLSTAMEHDPTTALAAWGRVKAEARQELASGHRTALSLEWGRTPWDRARFLAVREAFAADWKPRGGVESALLDLLAQAFCMYLIWTERLTLYHETQCQSEDIKQKQEGYWMPPRVGEARWLDWCSRQAEAAHRRFLMTLRALQDLRRLPAVFVGGVSQINIAHTQANLSAPGPTKRRGADRGNLPKAYD